MPADSDEDTLAWLDASLDEAPPANFDRLRASFSGTQEVERPFSKAQSVDERRAEVEASWEALQESAEEPEVWHTGLRISRRWFICRRCWKPFLRATEDPPAGMRRCDK